MQSNTHSLRYTDRKTDKKWFAFFVNWSKIANSIVLEKAYSYLIYS